LGGSLRGVPYLNIEPSPGVYFWLYPVFEAVGYGEIQLELEIQLGTARYAPIIATISHSHDE